MGVYTSIPALGFLCLHKYSLQQLFDGLERADGSQATLPDHTKLVLALALEKMQLFQRTNVSWIKDDELIPSACCKSRTKCIKEQAVMARVECLDRKVDVSFLLESWAKVGEGKWKGRLCAFCEEAAKRPYDVARKKAWGMLPSFFGLVPWEELTDAE
ncbi:hypothetical protein R3P38DRAFT_1849524 [Favolaschia claudopus]|uniref:Uncharacterized protein n=1 Tax=Favolaschia claudopus TaxID=2862362 RepID=A0AAW0DBP1_9AGAR